MRFVRAGVVGTCIPPRPRVVALLLACLLCAGCYSYLPAPGGGASLPAGSELRVELTPIGASRLAALIGPRAVRIDGRLVSTGGDGSMTVVPRTIESMDGMQSPWSGDAPMVLPSDAIASVKRRQFSRRRTMITAGAAAAAAVTIGVVAARRGGDGSGGGGAPPPPPP